MSGFRVYSLEELEEMRRAIHRQMVDGEGWNPHNPYELARVVEERLRTHMQNGDNPRVLRERALELGKVNIHGEKVA